MGLQSVFINGVNTIFTVLKDAVKEGQYVVITDDGFNPRSEDSYPVRVILDRFTQDDVEFSSFYDLIQPTDTKGMIPGEDLSVPMNTAGTLTVGDRKFTIVAFETDPVEALFTLLLRDTK